MKKWFFTMSTIVLVLGLGACNDETDDAAPATGVDELKEEENLETGDVDNPNLSDVNETGEEELSSKTVDLIDTSGNSVGVAELTEEEDGVRVNVNVTGLPEGLHGFHFHEIGKCEAPDFESAGSHFNPTGANHGLESENGPHAGDLPNLEVGADGAVDEEFLAELVTLTSGQDNSLLREGGTALVIHAEADDDKTQPSGNSGDRIACGVVQ
ncbi:superoxide dismutase family protein [Sporosarcina sp. ACRSM]|uniref:superoxide dismutase family protein n=1 Tax=Sporosarcina sp. ACRSM TaxID=2918216 RepID=UPI001EF58F4A|nr:superoxide dismutase family protein [Sporosarcina sp. ACRSM]MCG7337212.1 superoxide dismutase family protein [Sporosarcina sp. ACRSM]